MVIGTFRGSGRSSLAFAVAVVVAYASSAVALGPDPTSKPSGPATTIGKPVPPSLKRALQQSPPRDLHALPQTAKPMQGKALQQPPTPTIQLKPGEIPKIEFDTPIYEFGRIKSGNDVIHDFWFTNTGNGPLEILQVKPS